MTLKIKHDFADDNALWAEFLSGSDKAYSDIYRKYAKKMFHLGVAWGADEDIIWDCIHDVFVKVYTGKDKFKPIHNIKFYLLVSFKNTLYSALTKKKLSLYELIPEEEVELPEEEKIIQTEEQENRTTQLSEIISSLTSRQKEIIRYRFIECLNIEEIGVLMEMNSQSVYNLIHRTIKKIKEVLKKNDFD